ncbi:MAG: alpha/beta hydrolase-fold protein [Pseudomonadota bacterium]
MILPDQLTAQDVGDLREDAKLQSPVLKRMITASVYLPAAYKDQASKSERFPVVYLLHGLGDNHTAWPKLGKIKPTLDRLINAGKVPPSIVVMPDADSSWYVNDVRPNGHGRVFDAFRTDLIASVDRSYRTVACKDGRVIGGLSMGGYGALLIGLAEPEKFAAIFSLSGAVFPENLSDDPKRRVWLASLFRGVHGDPIESARLKQWNIFDRLRTFDRTRDYPHVWLSTGDDDAFPSIVSGSVRVFQMLQKRNIPTELRIDDAGHHWSYWQKSVEPALIWASKLLRTKCTTADQ